MSFSQELERAIVNGYAVGRARFGELGIDMTIYAGRIRFVVQKNLGVSASDNEALAFVKRLHFRDLYLATACAKESLGWTENSNEDALRSYSSLAWNTLEREYKTFVNDLARYFFRHHFMGGDLAGDMLAELFLPDRFGNSRIMSYDGRSSLCTWIRAILANRSVNLQRGKAYAQTEEIDPRIPDWPSFMNVDRMVRARRYGDRLADAMKLVVSHLAPPERLLLLWRYEDGLQLAQIAKLLGIHQSNVSRRLRRLHRTLRNRIVASLTSKYQLSQAAIDDCLQDIVENPYLQISILDALKSAEPELAGCEHFYEDRQVAACRPA
jgi:RNA polymerase sigma factor (sigma-70 family)